MRFSAKELQEKKIVDNHQGKSASYSVEPEVDLVKMALTSFVDKTFYQTMNDKLSQLRSLCSQVDTDFLVKLSSWAREKGLRTVNQVMLMEAMKNKNFVQYFQKLVKRPDEIIDMLGYYCMVNNQNADRLVLANKLKKAIKIKMESFSDYQLSKYKGKGDVINLYDIVNITHAKSDSIGKLMNGTLEVAETWETKLSKDGNNEESWNSLLSEDKMGALALVRNLRNMIQSGVKEVDIINQIVKMDVSKVFPYQLIQSIDICDNEVSLSRKYPTLFNELLKKVSQSFEKYKNLFNGRVAVGVDNSGSMNTQINSNSKLMLDKMSMYYGVALAEMGADLYTWNTSASKVDLERFSFDQYRANGGGTNVNCLIAATKGNQYDTLFIITDEQSSFRIESSDVSNIIVWNVADYKHSLIPTYDRGYTYITGFNDAQFELVNDLRDVKSLVSAINSLSF